MAFATKHRDGAHARVYLRWLALPAWRRLTPIAKVALVTLLANYHPDRNREVALSVRDLADLLDASPATAASALTQLEDHGWLAPITRGRRGKRAPSVYRLTMHPDPHTNEPPTRDFEREA